MMHWSSIDAFFAMGGYAFYVWLSFGLTAFCVAFELLQLRNRRRSLSKGEPA